YRGFVGVADVDWRRPAELLRLHLIAVFLALLGVEPHKAFELRDRRECLQVSVFPRRMRRPLDRFARALRRDPDRRMGLLHWPRPGVHIIEVVVLALVDRWS